MRGSRYFLGAMKNIFKQMVTWLIETTSWNNLIPLWLRITATSHQYADVSQVNTYIPVTCYQRQHATRSQSSLRSRLARPVLVHSLSSLFPIFVSLFLTHSWSSPSPHRVSLFLSYSTYIIRTTRRQSVQRHRCRRLVYLASFSLSPFFSLPLVFSLSPLLPLLTLFNFSSLINRIGVIISSRTAAYSGVSFKHSYPRMSPLTKSFFILFLRKEGESAAKNCAPFVIVWQWQCARVWGVTTIRAPSSLFHVCDKELIRRAEIGHETDLSRLLLGFTRSLRIYKCMYARASPGENHCTRCKSCSPFPFMSRSYAESSFIPVLCFVDYIHAISQINLQKVRGKYRYLWQNSFARFFKVYMHFYAWAATANDRRRVRRQERTKRVSLHFARL